MNLYVRYFDSDTLATNMDEVVAFLETVRELKLSEDIISRVNLYYTSNNQYPFRLKVGFSNYVLFLKTEAKTLEEFKENERKRNEQKEAAAAAAEATSENSEKSDTRGEKKKKSMDALTAPQQGWYNATVMFKRVVLNQETGKYKYTDTRFRVRLKADSPFHCYDRVINYLKNRPDIDPRSQFPSIKSSSYVSEYIGESPKSFL